MPTMLYFFLFQRFLSDDQKIDLLYHLDNEADILVVIKTIKSPKNKRKAMIRLRNDESKAQVAKWLEDDESKHDVLYEIEKDEFRAEVIKDYKDDEKKIEDFSFIKSEQYIKEIIQDMKRDESIISALQQATRYRYLKNNDYIAEIIDSIKDEASKIEALKYLPNIRLRADIIERFEKVQNKIDALYLIKSNYEFQLKIINEFDNVSDIIAVIKHIDDVTHQAEIIVNRISSDEDKIDALFEMQEYRRYASLEDCRDNLIAKSNVIESLKDERNRLIALAALDEFDIAEDYKAEIIANFSNQELKIEQLRNKTIRRMDNKITVINSLDGDDIRLGLMEQYLPLERGKAEVIANLEHDENKLKALNNIRDDEFRVQIICSLKSDEIKAGFFQEYDDDYVRIQIIKSMNHDKNKIEALPFLQYDYMQVDVITTLESDEEKKKQIPNYQHETHKSIIISSFEDDQNKIDYLPQIENLICKAKIIASMKKDDLKISFLPVIKHASEEWAPRSDEANLMVIRSFDDEEKIIENLHFLSNTAKEILIRERLTTIERKKRAISSLDDESIKVNVIKGAFKENSDKIEMLSELQEEKSKAEVIASFDNDKIKLEYVEQMNKEENKAIILASLDDSATKIKELEKLNDEKNRAVVIASLGNDCEEIKIGYISQFNDDESILTVGMSLKSKKNIFDCLSKMNSDECIYSLIWRRLHQEKDLADAVKYLKSPRYKEYVITEIGDLDLLIELIPLIQDPNVKYTIVKNKFISREDVYRALPLLEDIEARASVLANLIRRKNRVEEKNQILSEITDEERIHTMKRLIYEENTLVAKKQALAFLSEEEQKVLCSSYENDTRLGDLIQEKEYYLYLESEGLAHFNLTENLETLERMYSKNDEIYFANYRVLNFIKYFGEDKVCLMASFPRIVDRLCELNETKILTLKGCITYYEEKYTTEDWTPLVQRILNNLLYIDDDFYKKIAQAQDQGQYVNYENLINMIINRNSFGISSIDELNNYNSIKEQACKEYLKDDDIDKAKEAVLQKVYSHGLGVAKDLIKKFGEDIDQIESESLKDYIHSLKEIIELDDRETLINIFNNVESVEFPSVFGIEKLLKKEFCKLYNKTFFKVQDAKKCEELGENVYEAGTDYSMLITSIRAYNNRNFPPKDFNKDWNQPRLSSQHFCGTYIRNDMIAPAPIPFVCFGFENMQDDSLILSDCRDMGSTPRGFVSKATRHERYYSPDNQINKTRFHNEIDYKRIQGGTKKQPDYIVVFKNNGKIKDEHWKYAQKAQADFGGKLPIIIVDIDKCLESEKNKVHELIKMYEASPSPELYEKIKIKIRNNNETCSRFKKEKFCAEELIDLEYMYSKTLNKKINKEDRMAIGDLSENGSIDYHVQKKLEYYTKNKKVLPQQKSLKDVLKNEEKIEAQLERVENTQLINHSKSKVHGVTHVKNVVLLSNYIGTREGLSEEELAIVEEAAIYHDISHKNDGDENHAKKGAEWYLKHIDSGLDKEKVAFLIEVHENNDVEDIKSIINEKFNDKSEEEKERILKLVKILQDADRLDVLRYEIDKPDYQRFDIKKINDAKNLELIGAVLELNVRQSIKNGFLTIKDGRVIRKERKISVSDLQELYRETSPKDRKDKMKDIVELIKTAQNVEIAK